MKGSASESSVGTSNDASETFEVDMNKLISTLNKKLTVASSLSTRIVNKKRKGLIKFLSEFNNDSTKDALRDASNKKQILGRLSTHRSLLGQCIGSFQSNF